MLASNNIMRKRNLALAAAYTAVDKGFREYRGRVVDRFGKEVEHELLTNVKAKEIEETVIDEKTGKEKKVKTTVNVYDPSNISEYAKFFDASCRGWNKDPELSRLFLQKQQAQMNDILRRRGYLFLNEAYEMLGIDKTATGQQCGWVYDENNTDTDNYVDLGIFNGDREPARRFVNGLEQNVLLEPNCQGYIVDKVVIW